MTEISWLCIVTRYGYMCKLALPGRFEEPDLNKCRSLAGLEGRVDIDGKTLENKVMTVLNSFTMMGEIEANTA